MKVDVLGDLPAKTEVVERVAMTPTQWALYQAAADAGVAKKAAALARYTRTTTSRLLLVWHWR